MNHARHFHSAAGKAQLFVAGQENTLFVLANLPFPSGDVFFTNPRGLERNINYRVLPHFGPESEQIPKLADDDTMH